MSKATPIEHLPQASNSGNVQMNMAPEQNPGNAMPPQPHMGQQQMQNGNQMHQDMGQDQELQRMDAQDNYLNRQFVPQSRGNIPPTNYDDQQYMGPPQGSYEPQMPPSVPRRASKFTDDVAVPRRASKFTDDVDIASLGILQSFMSQSKMLSILFALLLCVQLETTQGLFRKVTRMIKVPDSMVFTASKAIASLVGVIAFFFIYRNM